MSAITEYIQLAAESNTELARLHDQIESLARELKAARESSEFWRKAYMEDLRNAYPNERTCAGVEASGINTDGV